jgi:hypothetical protein
VIPGAVAAAAALAVGACGAAKFPERDYRVVLRGVPGAFVPMAPHAHATATVRVLFDQREVCWSFASMSGVADPTRAEIHAGAAGSYGSTEVVLGPHFASSGCTTHVPVAQLNLVLTRPDQSYVEVDSRRYPSIGAIRAQL